MSAKPFCDGPFKIIKGTGRIVGKDKHGDDCHVLDQRGWGYLTGKGHAALGMDMATASQMQADMQQWVVDALNAAWEARDTKAKLAKAVEALRKMAEGASDNCEDEARAVLAEIEKGGV
jgi:hypothetical protein